MEALLKMLLKKAVKSSKTDIDDLFYELYIRITHRDTVGVVSVLQLLLKKWEAKLARERANLMQLNKEPVE